MPNTTILSAAVNQNFSDIATGLSDALTRDGQAGMTQPFKAVSGSVSAPGISFNADATAGLYLSTTGIVGLVAKSLGILINSAILQVASATVQAGGSGYAVGDNIITTGGTAINQAVLTVATLSGSAVATVTVAYPGNYTAAPSNPVSQGSTDGLGTGCTLNLTFATQFTKSIVTDESGNLAWQRLGASSFVSSIMAKANGYDYTKAIFTPGAGVALSNATSPPTLTATLSPPLVPNYLSGFTMSTAGSSGTMTIGPGVANDSTNATLMKLSSSISKTTASWAVGSGNGGIDTGSIANSTWYHFYEIERPDTGVVDVIFSLSASSPTLPSNYTLYRRIGSGKTDTSAHWVAFSQLGDEFLLVTSVQDSTANATATGALITLGSVPTGFQCHALFRAVVANTAGGSMTVLFTSPDESDQATSFSLAASAAGQTPSGQVAIGGDFNIRTNTSAQIRQRSNTTPNTTSIFTKGWIDPRGKNG